MTTIAERIGSIRNSISRAAEKSGRDLSKIRLICVSKTKPLSNILEAFNAGETCFGESYAQEMRDKVKELESQNPEVAKKIEWHFIGHLQKNKVKYVAPVATWIHSIDSLELAETINKRATSPINVLIEINIASENSKTGITEETVFSLIPAMAAFKNLRLKGLMCMPPISDETESSRPYFRRLNALLAEINRRNIYPEPLTELSMGMTQDFEVAIEEGATIIRVGTAIFEAREYT